jgi:hypothetical protein
MDGFGVFGWYKLDAISEWFGEPDVYGLRRGLAPPLDPPPKNPKIPKSQNPKIPKSQNPKNSIENLFFKNYVKFIGGGSKGGYAPFQ